MATVHRKAVNQMIVAQLLAALSGSGIRVYAPHEPTPSHDPDQSGDTTVAKWCKVHRVAISPMQDNGPADQRSISLTISVGVSPATVDADPHAIDVATQSVHEAIEHATRTHSDGVHSLQVYGVESDVQTAGQHENDATGIVSIVGSAKRSPS